MQSHTAAEPSSCDLLEDVDFLVQLSEQPQVMSTSTNPNIVIALAANKAILIQECGTQPTVSVHWYRTANHSDSSHSPRSRGRMEGPFFEYHWGSLQYSDLL